MWTRRVAVNCNLFARYCFAEQTYRCYVAEIRIRILILPTKYACPKNRQAYAYSEFFSLFCLSSVFLDSCLNT